MTIRESLSKIRDILQDTDKTYWSDSELLDIHNECKRYLAAERKESPTYTDVALTTGTNRYTVDGVLRYVSIKDSEDNTRPLYAADDEDAESDNSGVVIEDYNSIYVNDPETGVTLTIKHIAFPAEDNLNDVIRQGDENCYKYFTLAKAYEKDTEMQNFAKGNQFLNSFYVALREVKKNNNLNYLSKVQTTKVWYY